MHLPTDSAPPLILLDGPCAECGAYVSPYWYDAGAEWFWLDEHGRAYAFDVHPGDLYARLGAMRERVLAGVERLAKEYDAKPKNLRVAIGASAGPCCTRSYG